jgi:hypothetical protein
VVAWGFLGTKSQTSNLSNQETWGAITKSKKAPLEKTRTPNLFDSEKMMFHFKTKFVFSIRLIDFLKPKNRLVQIKKTNIQFSRVP